jgi:[ribosomal protein S18]-alanine N-acetyltransferase
MAAAEFTEISSELTCSIEHMTEHHLLEVCQIEELTDLSAWGWDAYHQELNASTESIMLVARVDPAAYGFELAGFIVARLVAGEMHVNNVAVRTQFRRSGLGAVLLETTLFEARKRGATVAHLEVRAGNQAAQALYQRSGFEVVGRRRKYYRNPVEDALLMSLWLESGPVR